MKKPALTLARKYRSGLEERVAKQLAAAGVEHTYEDQRIEYVVPQRTAKYIPDFPITDTHILIEAKGHFGGFKDIRKNSAEARQKMLLVKEQHPELDIRIVFERAATKIYPGSPTTQGQWATDHGFKWADKGVVPEEWIKELKQLAARKKRR